MSSNNIHDEWLSLVEISGPFLAPPVLNEAFPQGLDLLEPSKRKRLRQTYEEWREALEAEDPEFAKLHHAWIKEVISNCLSFDEDSKGAHLKFGAAMPSVLAVQIPEQGVTVAPEYVLVDEQHDSKPLLLIQSYASGVDLQAAMSIDGWSATPADRMVQLCRLTGCRLGLVTDGERWMLIDAPVGAVTTFASWYARLWIQEPITLQAFVHLLGIRRFFVATGEQIPALIDKSLQHQDEVTTALGEQVQRAVEVLIQSLDRADQDRNRELLKEVTPAELYEAGLTVMMRLVFLLSAEERGLLLMGDECYEENYAISTLRMQLRSESEEILERRWDAWSRLLSVFRAVYGGIDHENMRLPALGGSLFDPDRFPFLEGRTKGSNWHKEPAKPLPIDNRTVLLLLEAIQQYQGRSLSYRALDVEQIGYVYEGLLERTVKRTSEVILDVGATRSAEKPLVSLVELQSLSQSGESALSDSLVERTGSSITRVKNALAKPIDDQLSDRLLAACMGNIDLRNQIKPYANLLRIDPWGYPLVYPADSFVVIAGAHRRETGAHYTPKSLTEIIVDKTLAPLSYLVPEKRAPQNEWILKSPKELLDLKICDPAMGSGAFLVQACRWLSERLQSSWEKSEKIGMSIGTDGQIIEIDNPKELLPADSDTRSVIARRLIAERCLYGVDLNPLAVELAKLSIWLVTLSKGRPFGFLDHNLRCGDTLLGIHRLDQLTELNMMPGNKNDRSANLFGQSIEDAVQDAIEIRQTLRSIPIRDIHDVEMMSKLDSESRCRLEVPERIADALIAKVLNLGANSSSLNNELTSLSILADQALEGDTKVLNLMASETASKLSSLSPSGDFIRKPFHWPLEFPEIFNRINPGFNAFIGNPPFLRGHDISGTFGHKYRDYLASVVVQGNSGIADLCAYFIRRASSLVSNESCSGFIATNSISEGDSKNISLSYLVNNKFNIIFAAPNLAWPGKASVVVSPFVVFKGTWNSNCYLYGELCDYINESLSSLEGLSIKTLKENDAKAFVGCYVLGKSFEFSSDEAAQILLNDYKNSCVMLPYLNGIEMNSLPTPYPKRFIACFWDWDIEKASSYSEVFEAVKNNKETDCDKDKWWLYARSRPDLYHQIGMGDRFSKHPRNWTPNSQPLKSVIVKAKTSNTWGFEIYPISVIFDQALTVIASDEIAMFAMLQSSIHELWARYSGAGSAMKTDLRYAPTLFETFPFPKNVDGLVEIGNRYYDYRSEIMKSQNVGLTKLYNDFHDPLKEDGNNIDMLRELHRELDEAVLKSYGWLDINLEHNFYDAQDLHESNRSRFTISDIARAEVLRRLSDLNLQRYQEQVEKDLSAVSEAKVVKSSKHIDLISQPSSMQSELDL